MIPGCNTSTNSMNMARNGFQLYMKRDIPKILNGSCRYDMILEMMG